MAGAYTFLTLLALCVRRHDSESNEAVEQLQTKTARERGRKELGDDQMNTREKSREEGWRLSGDG